MQKKKKLIIFLGVCLLILMFCLAMIIIYLKTDFLKSNKQLFFKYLIEDNQMWEMLSIEKPENNDKSYTSTGTVDFIYEYEGIKEVENDNISKELKQDFKNLKNIENLSGDISSSVDKNNKKATYKFQLLNGDSNVMNFELVKDNDKYAFKNDALKKYVGIQNNNINNFSENMEIINNDEIVPNKIDFENVKKYFFELKKEEKEHIYETYKNIIIQSLDEKNFYNENGKLIYINNTEYTTNLYTLTITKAEAIELLSKILQTLKQDSVTLNIICNKIKIINPESKYTNIKEVVKQIDIFIEKVEKQEKTDSEFIKINVYKENNCARKVDIIIENWKQLSLEYDIKNDKENLQINQKNLLNEPTSISYNIIDSLLNTKKIKITKDNNVKTYQLVFYNLKEIYKNIIEQIENGNIDKADLSLNEYKKIYEAYKEKNDEEVEISLNYEKYNQKENTTKSIIYLLVCNSKVGAEINNKIKYTEDIQGIVDLNDNNSIMINNSSKQSVENFINQIYLRTVKLLSKSFFI